MKLDKKTIIITLLILVVVFSIWQFSFNSISGNLAKIEPKCSLSNCYPPKYCYAGSCVDKLYTMDACTKSCPEDQYCDIVWSGDKTSGLTSYCAYYSCDPKIKDYCTLVGPGYCCKDNGFDYSCFPSDKCDEKSFTKPPQVIE